MTQRGRGRHQSQLASSLNKFHAGNGSDGKHYWLTPPELYASLDAEFHFTFDPCPYPLPEGFDGLTCEWGERNYVNPPFGSIVHQGKKKGPTAWVRKAIEEQRKGKLTVLVYPVDKWVLMMLSAIGTKVRNLGDVRWLSIEDRQAGKGTGRQIAAFILEPRISAIDTCGLCGSILENNYCAHCDARVARKCSYKEAMRSKAGNLDENCPIHGEQSR